MPGGASFISDQQSVHKATGTHVMRAARARLTSIQAKGHANGTVEFHDCKTTGAVSASNLKVKYTFGTEGLDLYFPGSGVLFKEGITAVITKSGGSTISYTG